MLDYEFELRRQRALPRVRSARALGEQPSELLPRLQTDHAEQTQGRVGLDQEHRRSVLRAQASARVRAPTGRGTAAPRRRRTPAPSRVLGDARPRVRIRAGRAFAEQGRDEPRGLDVSQADERRDLELGVVVQAPRRRRDRRLHRGVRVGIAAVLPAGRGPVGPEAGVRGRGGGERLAVQDRRAKAKTRVARSGSVGARDRIECKGKASVIGEMFMRPGGRDPLDGYAASDSSWKGITGARWTYHKALERTGSLPRDWEPDYPVSASTATIGRLPRPDESTIEWLCPAPPVAFSQVARESGPGRRFAPLRIDSRAARARDPAEWRGFDALCSRVLSCPLEKRWTRGLCVVVNKGLSEFQRETRVPISGLIEITEPGRWYAKLSAGDTEGVPSSTPELRSPVFHSEVGEAPELIEALASAMLSGETHGELEIRCARPGLYGYLQRAIAWFAGASGPFRCRSVTVFTPEADSLSPRALDLRCPGLGRVEDKRAGFLVSTAEPRGPDDELTLLLEKSRDAILVRSSGNLVLHADPGGLRVSAIRGRFAPCQTRGKATGGKRSQASAGNRGAAPALRRSLREFCELRTAEGIRGPRRGEAHAVVEEDRGAFCAGGGAEVQVGIGAGGPFFLAPSRHGRDPPPARTRARWKRRPAGLIPAPKVLGRIDSGVLPQKASEAQRRRLGRRPPAGRGEGSLSLGEGKASGARRGVRVSSR
ncbi:hypothetical protein Q5P01_000840 [Channa striata]|uniref:Uncharacterized protein n=1 Tax=Channa striata TaxID=64152 RepID=A0AA88IJM9_CHASR|nr:hypothetical protein Q5P01_000840 [Channa striata]